MVAPIVHTARTTQPFVPSRPRRFQRDAACTSQYDGRDCPHFVQDAVPGDREPHAAEKREQCRRRHRALVRSTPAMTTCYRCKMPSAANGMRPTRMSKVIFQPVARVEADSEGRARPREQGDRDERHCVAGQHFRAEVECGRQGGDPQLAVPADRPLRRDSRPSREHRVHSSEREQPDHEVERRRDAAAVEVVNVAVGADDQDNRARAGTPNANTRKRRFRKVRSNSYLV